MGWVFFDRFNRAQHQALGFVVVANALGAEIWIDLINFGAEIDRLVGANRFTNVAVDAIFGDY